MFTPGSQTRRLMAAVLTFLVIAAAGLPAAPVSAAGAAGARAAADPIPDAIARAVAWLKTQQLPDGSFGYRGDSSASMTADVVYALAVAGEQPNSAKWTPAGGRSALAALETLAPGYVGTDAGQAGKVARAVSMAGGNPRSFGGMDLIAIIQAAYDPATGRYHPSFAFRHSVAMEALYRAGFPVPPAAITALQDAQLPDGGWFWSFNQVAGQKSDVDTTGRVLQVLAGLLDVQDPSAYAAAGGLLANLQLPGGGWNDGVSNGPANTNSTSLAVGGLVAAGFDPQGPLYQKNGKGAVDTLLAAQEPSGAFAYTAANPEVRLMATAEALVALSQVHDSRCEQCEPMVYLPLILR